MFFGAFPGSLEIVSLREKCSYTELILVCVFLSVFGHFSHSVRPTEIKIFILKMMVKNLQIIYM